MTRTMINRLKTARALIYNALRRGESVFPPAVAQAAAATPSEAEELRPHIEAFMSAVVNRGPFPDLPVADLAPNPLTQEYVHESLALYWLPARNWV